MIKKSDIYASVGTIVVSAIVLLILLFCGMSASRNEVDEGVLVSFGDEIEGFGTTEEPATPQDETPAAVAPPAPITPIDDRPLMTQDDESVVLEQEKRQREKEERQRRLEEQRREQERLAQEEARRQEQERLAAEQKAKTDKATSLAGVFGQKVGDGSGTSVDESMQGNPVGSGSSGGHNWSVKGRDLKENLEEPASLNANGKITIKIRVDRSGRVLSAEYDPTTSTIVTASLIENAKKSALKAQFTEGKQTVEGIIIYNFSTKTH